MRRPALALALLAALALPAQAAAQTPPAPTPAPAPAPAPAATATLSISARDVLGGKRPAALTGRTFTARVVMKPFVANETRGPARLPRQEEDHGQVADVQAGRRRRRGRGDVQGELEAAGRLTLKASHRATPALATRGAKTVRVTSCAPTRAPARAGRR